MAEIKDLLDEIKAQHNTLKSMDKDSVEANKLSKDQSKKLKDFVEYASMAPKEEKEAAKARLEQHNQTQAMLAKTRGVSEEGLVKLQENARDSNNVLQDLLSQQEMLKEQGVKDFTLQSKIDAAQKRKDRADKKLEGGRITRAKQAMKSAALQFATLKGIGEGIKGLGKGLAGGLKGIGGKGMKGVQSLFGLIMKGAMLALLPAILLFFNSPLWDKTKTFLMETALPAVKRFYHEAIVPAFNFIKDEILPILLDFVSFLKEKILPIFTTAFAETWENIKELFGNLKASFDKIMCGDIIGGIMGIIGSIGKFVLKQLDIGLTAVFNIVASIFGLETTDSVFGSIKGFFTDLYDKVAGFVSGGWEFVKEKLVAAFGVITSIGDWIGNIFCNVVDWIKGVFAWGSDNEDESWSLSTFIGNAFRNIKNWFLGLFKWGEEDEQAEGKKFSMSKFIGGIFDDIVAWFKGIFDIDFAGLAASLLPDNRLGRWLGEQLGIVPEGSAEAEMMESDAETKAKIDEARAKGDIKAIGTVDPFGPGQNADYLNRAALEKEVVAGNGGGTLITTNNVSTTKNVTSETNVSPVQDQDQVIKSVEAGFF